MHNLRHNIHNVYKSAAETLLPVRSSSAFKVKAGGSRRNRKPTKSETVNTLTSLLVCVLCVSFHFAA